MSLLLCLLLAVAPRDAIVEGRVGEPGGAPAAFAVVKLTQGDRRQLLRTGPDGRFRFRAFLAPGSLSVALPQGWTSTEPLSRPVEPSLRGDVIRADFVANARRVLHGRLLIAGAPFGDAEVAIGAASVRTDASGRFVLDQLPAGALELHVAAPPLLARIDMPAGAADVTRDVSVQVSDLASLRLTPLPQGEAERRIGDWIAGRPLTRSEASAIERLAALSTLDPAFRLAIVARRAEAVPGARAAARLQRYLTGPALVPPERVLFAVGELAKPGHVKLLLTRLEETP